LKKGRLSAINERNKERKSTQQQGESIPDYVRGSIKRTRELDVIRRFDGTKGTRQGKGHHKLKDVGPNH